MRAEFSNKRWLPIPDWAVSIGPALLALLSLHVATSLHVIAGFVACGTVLLGSVVAQKGLLVGRWLASLGAVAAIVLCVIQAPREPSLVLMMAVIGIYFVFALWRRGYADLATASDLGVVAACLMGGGTCLVLSFAPNGAVGMVSVSAATALGGCSVLTIREVFTRWQSVWARGIVTAMMLLATVVALLYGTGRLASGTIALVSVAPFVSSLVLLPRTQSGPSLFNRLVDQPARLLVATFAALCIVGGLGVALPWCSSSGATVGVLDAFFTAVSASCVTGLMVLDVSKDLSLGGQLLVLGLIQAGGLGIMTISSAAMALLGRRLSLHQEQVMAQLVSEKNRADLYSALTRTVIVTGACELAGAIGLTAAFWHAGDSLGKAVWRAVFTSISAFCNAGISLQSDNLVGYQTSPAVLYIVSALIIAGGLSPAVIVVIPKWIRGQRTSVQARISLVGTAALLVIGLLLIALVEWSASLAALAWDDRLHNAWFQSVTLRTAGFNSIDFAALRPATWMVMIALMFVGGCPGSTAGGIKVTTAVVLLLSVVGSLRGPNAAQAYGRKISQATVFKAASIVTVGGLAVVLVTTLLLITQPIPFESAMFEVVSAFGTVGVSLGATTQLDEIGKIIIITCMFLGRVGPLSVFLVLSDRNHPDSWSLPQEEINVG